MKYAAVKIWGERNSGTNFVENCVKKSFSLNVVRNIPDLDPAHRDRIRASNISELTKLGLIERNWDKIYVRAFKNTLGWKHEFVTDERFALYKELRKGKCCFLFVVRNPISWAKSMHKHPFHRLDRVPPKFSAFIRAPWVTVEREQLDADVIDDPITLWKLKNEQYHRLAADSDALIVRYEDFLLDLDRMRVTLGDHFGEEVAELIVPQESARKFVPDQSTYADRADSFSFAREMDSVDAADRDFILERCEGTVLAELYPELRV